MQNNNVAEIPIAYKQAVGKERQGTLMEVFYRVKNYINTSRQLVTNQNISCEEAGRETVDGEELVKTCVVYLPYGYDNNDKDTRYNVLYLFHGGCGNRYEWFAGNTRQDGNNALCNLLDNLIANGDIEPVIVVFPKGRSAYDWTDTSFHSEGTNMLGFYYFDLELRYDLIPVIETKFNTYSNFTDTTLKVFWKPARGLEEL
jgi:hypothetical protein